MFILSIARVSLSPIAITRGFTPLPRRFAPDLRDGDQAPTVPDTFPVRRHLAAARDSILCRALPSFFNSNNEGYTSKAVT
jgi:hypothetical protein